MLRQNQSIFARLRNEGLEEGLEKGREEGREEGRGNGLVEGLRLGRLELIEAQLDSKFGALSESVLVKLRSLSDGEIRTLGVKLPNAESLAELGL